MRMIFPIHVDIYLKYMYKMKYCKHTEKSRGYYNEYPHTAKSYHFVKFLWKFYLFKRWNITDTNEAPPALLDSIAFSLSPEVSSIMNLLLTVPMNVLWILEKYTHKYIYIYIILLCILKHYINDIRQYYYSATVFSFIIVFEIYQYW